MDIMAWFSGWWPHYLVPKYRWKDPKFRQKWGSKVCLQCGKTEAEVILEFLAISVVYLTNGKMVEGPILPESPRMCGECSKKILRATQTAPPRIMVDSIGRMYFVNQKGEKVPPPLVVSDRLKKWIRRLIEEEVGRRSSVSGN